MAAEKERGGIHHLSKKVVRHMKYGLKGVSSQG